MRVRTGRSEKLRSTETGYAQPVRPSKIQYRVQRQPAVAPPATSVSRHLCSYIGGCFAGQQSRVDGLGAFPVLELDRPHPMPHPLVQFAPDPWSSGSLPDTPAEAGTCQSTVVPGSWAIGCATVQRSVRCPARRYQLRPYWPHPFPCLLHVLSCQGRIEQPRHCDLRFRTRARGFVADWIREGFTLTYSRPIRRGGHLTLCPTHRHAVEHSFQFGPSVAAATYFDLC
jgi:hypothetical protein